MSRSKERLCTRISPRLHALLTAAGKRKGASQTDIVDAALEGFFSEERHDQRDAAIIRRLDQLTRQFSRLERNDLILTETITLAMRFLFSITPPLTPTERDAARALSVKRFDEFTKRLARQLSTGRRVLEEALEEIIPDRGDFASLANLDAGAPITRPHGNSTNHDGRADV